jgi:hypothetical protein
LTEITGTLSHGKGNRLILANTEELHDRIETLCVRIRELENALRTLQESVSPDPHPLLQAPSGVLRPMTSQNLQFPATSSPSRNTPTSQGSSVEPHPPSAEDESFVDAFGEQAYRIFLRAPNPLYFLGTLTLGRRGESTFFGQTARAEVGCTRYPPGCSDAYLASFSVFDQCKISTMAKESG